MVYLLLAIICSSTIALIFKYSETREFNRFAVTTINYLTASIVSLILIFCSKKQLFVNNIFSGLLAESKRVFKYGLVFSESGGIGWAIIAGFFAGVFFFLAFIYYQKSVKEEGVGLAGVFSKLGIIVPMVLSIILWSEYPEKFQWIGIILALISIVIINLSKKKISHFSIRLSLIYLFIFGGLAEFSNKIYQKYGLIEYRDLFLFSVFFTAFIISLIVTTRHKSQINQRDLLVGFLVGVPNLFSSFFLIYALQFFKTAVVFPLYSAGSIVLIILGGVILFKEKIYPKDFWGIVLTIIALILINIS